MKKLAIFLFAALIIYCKKDKLKDIPTALTGLWVEKTLRLDTMEFNSFLASSTQSIYFRSQQSFKGYHYQIKTDSILLLSFGSSSGFNSYYFNFNNSNNFTVSNFFQRSALPATVQFEKIK